MSGSKEFDICIIGGGPGGYVCAIRAAQLGLKVACVESRNFLGGTCLNEGCIPSKALLHSSYLYHQAEKEFKTHGISVKGLSVDLSTMMKRKDNVMNNLGKGIDGLFLKNKITKFQGVGTIKTPKEVIVDCQDGSEQLIVTKNIVIATGSEVIDLPGIPVDGQYIISSREALEISSIPKTLAIIGAGVIGIEMASVWSRLGSKVTIFEYADAVLPGMDKDVSVEIKKILEKQGIKFELSTKVLESSVDSKKSVAKLKYENSGSVNEGIFEKILVAVGRRPFTFNLGLESQGVELDKRGAVIVNEDMMTSINGIYAIGDVVDKGPMLAHKAEEEGIYVANLIAGSKIYHDPYNRIPAVVYTHPEVAAIGITEQEAKEKGIEYKVGKFPFIANSRARANGDMDGFVKVITDKNTGEILGAHIIGAEAGTLIGEFSVAMGYRASAEDISLVCHSHPDRNEAIKEACLAAFFKPIHM